MQLKTHTTYDNLVEDIIQEVTLGIRRAKVGKSILTLGLALPKQLSNLLKYFVLQIIFCKWVTPF